MGATVDLYGLTDPRTGEIRYIGKANCAAKRMKGHLRDARRRRTPVYDWIGKLRASDLTPGLVVLEVCAAECWQERERALIAEYRASGRLLNVADGGDEPHCPLDVRRENAKHANDMTIRAYRVCVRRMAEAARFAKSRGNAEGEAKFSGMIDWLRSFTKAQRVEFSRRYVARYGMPSG